MKPDLKLLDDFLSLILLLFHSLTQMSKKMVNVILSLIRNISTRVDRRIEIDALSPYLDWYLYQEALSLWLVKQGKH